MMKLTVCFVVLMAIVTLNGVSAEDDTFCTELGEAVVQCSDNIGDDPAMAACMKEKLQANTDVIKLETECAEANPGDDAKQEECMKSKIKERCGSIDD